MNTLVRKLKTIEIEAHKLKLHMLLRKLGVLTGEEMQSSIEFFANESRTLGHYNTICITKQNKIISQPEVWQAAMKIDPNMMLTVDVLDIEDDDLIRFINAKSIFQYRNYISSWALIRELRKYLEENPNGISWFNDLSKGDIIETLHHITGRSESLIKQYQVIGKYADENPTLKVWDGIGYGDDKKSLKAMEFEIKNAKGIKAAASDFTLNDEDRKAQEEKQAQMVQKSQKQDMQALKLQGNERLYFQLNWKESGRVFKNSGTTNSSDPSMMSYQMVNDDGVVLVQIIVNVPEVFAVTSNPINLKP